MHLENINNNTVLTIDLKKSDKSNERKMLKEIMIPTCSYRMGVKQTGYGMAVLGKRVSKVRQWYYVLIFSINEINATPGRIFNK